ncbi:PhaM family polyhydroxyalkanoate granule multifunctional regulatory protein [Paralcaligenes ureilyticus]|uniref:Uncharacterized protein n=1 Tax=Paralcaligenes ureilyticus TaxID=627131 RepID=A0A4R3LWR5_9BURK|nr:PhaM family polyhydroxyalkanoate granule multifunctional regulatory protein [Paralcaligenes ureilyticus]TCT03115.1 hypothetical protein EDC26_11682 [Paralcaligenes ureilyticus]
MTTQNSNPFVLPGLGQGADLGKNPLMASLEMMQQAWQGLSGAGGLGQSAMAAPTSIEDLDRRITDLRAVENWLRMNLSMLSSAIQGLEVQRATIATLKSFMTASGMAATPDSPSPLEVVLGIKPAAANAAAPAQDVAAPLVGATKTPAKDKTAASDQATSNTTATAPNPGSATPPQPDLASAQAATQGWWNMLQKQFDTLAAATTASMQSAEAVAKAATVAPRAESGSNTRPGARAGAAAKTAKAAKAAPRKRAATSKKTQS